MERMIDPYHAQGILHLLQHIVEPVFLDGKHKFVWEKNPHIPSPTSYWGKCNRKNCNYGFTLKTLNISQSHKYGFLNSSDYAFALEFSALYIVKINCSFSDKGLINYSHSLTSAHKEQPIHGPSNDYFPTPFQLCGFYDVIG